MNPNHPTTKDILVLFTLVLALGISLISLRKNSREFNNQSRAEVAATSLSSGALTQIPSFQESQNLQKYSQLVSSLPVYQEKFLLSYNSRLDRINVNLYLPDYSISETSAKNYLTASGYGNLPADYFYYVLTNTAPTPTPTPLIPNPLGWWKFDECAGTSAVNSSGSSLTGTISIGNSGDYLTAGSCNSGRTTEAWNAGSVGKNNSALGLDGTNDRVYLPGFKYGSSFSYSLWVKPDTISVTQMLINKKPSGILDSVQFFTVNSSIYARVYSADNVFIGRFASSRLTAEWQHLALVYDGGSTPAAIKIYRNGIQVDTTSEQAGTFTVFNDLAVATEIGSQNSGQSYFNGLVDDVRIYNSALTANQVSTLAQP